MPINLDGYREVKSHTHTHTHTHTHSNTTNIPKVPNWPLLEKGWVKEWRLEGAPGAAVHMRHVQGRGQNSIILAKLDRYLQTQ